MLTALETANNQSDTPTFVKVRPLGTNLVPIANKCPTLIGFGQVRANSDQITL